MRGPIEDTRYELTVSASPADVLLALTDFGPMRAQIWPETSHSRVYRVHEVQAHHSSGLWMNGAHPSPTPLRSKT